MFETWLEQIKLNKKPKHKRKSTGNYNKKIKYKKLKDLQAEKDAKKYPILGLWRIERTKKGEEK